jgi:hypothetical protein
MSDPIAPPASSVDAPVPGAGVEAPAQPSPRRRRRVLTIVIVVVVVVVVGVLVRWGLTSVFGGSSEQSLINKSVAQMRVQTSFPKKLDAVTTFTGVDAEHNAIRYDYAISSDVTPSALPKAALRKAILPTLCSTTSTRNILNRDIAMHYHYGFTGTSHTIDITFTKADC